MIILVIKMSLSFKRITMEWRGTRKGEVKRFTMERR